MTGRGAWQDWGDALADHLEESPSLSVVLLDRDRNVVRVNDAFLRVTGLEAPPAGAGLASLLFPSSAEPAERLLSGGAGPERLQFRSSGGSVTILSCRASFRDGACLLLGEAPSLTETDAMRSLARLNAEMANLGRELERKNRELRQALEEIKVLQSMIPVCMHCGRIRDDQGEWLRLEAYLKVHAGTTLSHGLCEECLEAHFP